jgi:APA family basic amino acid/polyamine antiporter
VTERRDGIRARLSTFDASMIVVSLVVGIGIFRTPAMVAAGTGSETGFLLAWVLGGVVCALGALTFAEIGSRLAVPGGYYRAVAECYHPGLAFMLNWAGVLMQGAGAAGVAFLAAEHLVPLVFGGEVHAAAVPATASALMVALLLVNYAGIRAGANAQNALSLLKIGMILVLAGAAFLGPRATEATGGREATDLAAFVGAFVAVLYAYGGAHNAINVGGDVKDASRRLPRAILGGIAIVVLLYLLVNAAYVRALGVDGVAGAKLVAAELARVRFGASGHAVVSVAIVLSALGFVNATILHVPRSYYAMAQDGMLPRFFLHVNPRTEVQGGALLFFGATMLVPALVLRSFEKLLHYVVFTDALALAVAATTIFVLRRRARGDDGAFRAPGYPVAPAIFVAVLAGIAVLLLATQTTLSLIGLAIFLSGLPIYAGMRRLRARRA